MELRTRTIGLLSLALLSIAVGGPSSVEACECDQISLQPLSFAGHAGRTADGRTLLREATGFLIHGAGEWLSGVVARCGSADSLEVLAGRPLGDQTWVELPADLDDEDDLYLYGLTWVDPAAFRGAVVRTVFGAAAPRCLVDRSGGNLVARAIPPDSPVLLTRGTGP